MWKPIDDDTPRDRKIILSSWRNGHCLWVTSAEWGVAMPGYIQCASYSGWFIDPVPIFDPSKSRKEYVSHGTIIGNTWPPTHWMDIPEC